jgi:hypothetical protein
MSTAIRRTGRVTGGILTSEARTETGPIRGRTRYLIADLVIWLGDPVIFKIAKSRNREISLQAAWLGSALSCFMIRLLSE